MANLLNQTLDRGKAIEKLKGITIKAYRRTKMAEVTSKCLKEVLSKVEANLAKIKADWALEKEKMELEVAKARVELVEAKKESKEAIAKYRASKDFIVEKV